MAVQTTATPAKGNSYRFVAVNAQNELVKGQVKAPSEASAGQLLVERGLRPVELQAKPARLSLEEAFPSLFRVRPREVSTFSQQLATLIDSGLPMLRSLELIHHRTSNRAFRKILGAVIDDLRAGSSLSQCFGRHPEAFSPIYCRTIALAERTGNLQTILRQMSDYQQKQGTATKQLKGALTYPAIVLVVGIIVVIVLMTTALPSMIEMFEQAEMDLPLPTRILIAVTDFVNAQKTYLLGVAGAMVALVIFLTKRPAGRMWLDRFLLSVPLLGSVVHSAEIGHVSRKISSLLGAGLPLQEIMQTIPSTADNLVIRRSLSRLKDALIRGQGLSEPMAHDRVFPPLLTQMAMVGEESNTLQSSLAVAADFYETESTDKVAALARVVQPLAIMSVALLVGFMAIAVIMPMYTLTGSLQ